MGAIIDTWSSIETWGRNVRTDVRRATFVPNLVRGGVLVAGIGALFLAYPPVWWLPVLALFPALFPRSFAATAFIIAASILWIISTALEPDRLTLWRLCALAIVLYLVHVGCALAAVLPFDAVNTRGIFRPWIVRAAIVSVLTVAIGVVITALPRVIDASKPALAATIAGVVLMVTTAIFIAYLGNRRQ